MFNGVVFHQSAVDLCDTEQLTHMEAKLLFVLLLIRALILCPLYDIFYLGNLHIILFEDVENVLIKQTLIQCIHVSLCAETDSFVAGFLCSLYTILEFALIAQCP